MRKNTPVFRSPIQPTPRLSYASSRLQLSDLTGARILLVRGQARETLKKALGAAPEKPGDVVMTGDSLLVCLTPTEFWLFGRSPQADLPEVEALTNSEQFVHAVEMTHGKAVLRLVGVESATVLSKICGLDFHEAAFGNLHAAQTSAAKVKTLIVRVDEDRTPAYYLLVDRPFGQYFWDTVRDAGREWANGE